MRNIGIRNRNIGTLVISVLIAVALEGDITRKELQPGR